MNPNWKPVQIAQILFIGLYSLSISLCLAQASNVEKKYLEQNRLTSAIKIHSFRIEQAGTVLPLYNPIGREEKHDFAPEQPILTPAELPEIFVRGTEFVVRIQTHLDITLYLQCDHLQLDDQKQLRTTPIKDWFIRIYPGDEQFKHVSTSKIAVIPSTLHASKVVLNHPNPEGGHSVTLKFIPFSKPITLVPKEDKNH